jgi:hypothetical protein
MIRFQAPTSAPAIPAEISAVVESVVGLSTRPQYFPHRLRSAAALSAGTGGHAAAGSAGLINPLGSLTVADFSKYYDVLPLTARTSPAKGERWRS